MPFQPIDAGIDWSEIHQHHAMRRYVAVPLMQEASSLLQGCALLYQSRYGQGRLGAKRLTDHAHRLRGFAKDARRTAFGWSDPNIRVRMRGEEPLRNEEAIGHLLYDHGDDSSYRANGEPPYAKHPEAAGLLAAMAVALVEAAIPLLRQSGDEFTGSSAEKEAARWEDVLEALGEEPIFAADLPPPGDGFLVTMRHRAAHREAYRLCSMTGLIFQCASAFDDKHPRYARASQWYAESSAFATLADKDYDWFTQRKQPQAEELKAALLAVRDDGSHYSPSTDRIYVKDEQLARLEEVVAALISVQLRSNGIVAPDQAWVPSPPSLERAQKKQLKK